MKKLNTVLVVVLAFALVLASCKKTPSPQALNAFDGVIPKPVSAVSDGGVFFLNDETVVVTGGASEPTAIGNYLAGKLKVATGFGFSTSAAVGDPPSNSIVLQMSADLQDLGDEGYDLTITEDGVKLQAFKPAGLFRGVQTIRQLLPEKIELSSKQEGPWEIATGHIRDLPRYAWRGSMMDVARHFFGVEDIKRFIDLIAYYKMNTLHLHLSDDQGWRIEIKSWPNLTTVGGSTEVDGGKGGFYTQEQYRDLVAYAQQQYIMIVPEIDLPGHTNAALASYGELNSGIIVPEEGRLAQPQSAMLGKSRPTDLYIGKHVGFSTLRYEKPVTFKFVADVLGELAAITPGPYLHIGGDEAHVTAKADYIKFINRFKEIVRSNGKQMVGWNEIAQGELDSTDIVHFWDKADYVRMAVEKGASVLMSPAKKTYLDMQYDSLTKLGQNWAAYIEVDSAYTWDPSNYVQDLDPAKIIGVEAPLWTETIEDMEDIEYMVFPRLACLAEVAWTPQAYRNWDEYKVRLGRHGPRMTAMDINFYRSAKVPWADSVKMANEAKKVVGMVRK